MNDRSAIAITLLLLGTLRAEAACNIRQRELTLYSSGPGVMMQLPSTQITGTTQLCVAPGATFSFTATPNPGAVFNGWAGGLCSGTDSTCSITASATRSTVSATFRNPQITVQSPNGNVTSTPPGINCGGGGTACTAQFAPGTSVSLLATATPPITLSGWNLGAGLTHDNPATVVMNGGDKLVRAVFVDPRVRLSLSIAAVATDGEIEARNAAVSCPPSCHVLYLPDSTETLRAIPNGTLFKQWLGCPKPNDAFCSLTITAPMSITAEFALPQITVSLTGNGYGRVTSNPPGIDCHTGSCSAFFSTTRPVTFTIGSSPFAPPIPVRFDGWSEPSCQGTPPPPTCTVPANALTRTISAKFTLSQ